MSAVMNHIKSIVARPTPPDPLAVAQARKAAAIAKLDRLETAAARYKAAISALQPALDAEVAAAAAVISAHAAMSAGENGPSTDDAEAALASAAKTALASRNQTAGHQKNLDDIEMQSAALVAELLTLEGELKALALDRINELGLAERAQETAGLRACAFETRARMLGWCAATRAVSKRHGLPLPDLSDARVGGHVMLHRSILSIPWHKIGTSIEERNQSVLDRADFLTVDVSAQVAKFQAEFETLLEATLLVDAK